MEMASFVVSQISLSEKLLNSAKIDRTDQFMPRIMLAKIQYLFDTKNYNEASNAFESLISKGLPEAVLNDFLNLFSSGFTMRSQYVADEKL